MDGKSERPERQGSFGSPVRPGASPRAYKASSRRLAYRDLQGPNAMDAAFDLIAGREGGHACRRPRHDDIAGAERNLLRELGNDLRNAPDQFSEVSVLAFGAVDRKPDSSFGWMTNL